MIVPLTLRQYLPGPSAKLVVFNLSYSDLSSRLNMAFFLRHTQLLSGN